MPKVTELTVSVLMIATFAVSCKANRAAPGAGVKDAPASPGPKVQDLPEILSDCAAYAAKITAKHPNAPAAAGYQAGFNAVCDQVRGLGTAPQAAAVHAVKDRCEAAADAIFFDKSATALPQNDRTSIFNDARTICLALLATTTKDPAVHMSEETCRQAGGTWSGGASPTCGCGSVTLPGSSSGFFSYYKRSCGEGLAALDGSPVAPAATQASSPDPTQLDADLDFKGPSGVEGDTSVCVFDGPTFSRCDGDAHGRGRLMCERSMAVDNLNHYRILPNCPEDFNFCVQPDGTVSGIKNDAAQAVNEKDSCEEMHGTWHGADGDASRATTTTTPAGPPDSRSLPNTLME